VTVFKVARLGWYSSSENKLEMIFNFNVLNVLKK
jgi:hypothetical protein